MAEMACHNNNIKLSYEREESLKSYNCLWNVKRTKKKRNKLSGNHVLSDEQPFNGFIKYSEFFSKLENKNICRH